MVTFVYDNFINSNLIAIQCCEKAKNGSWDADNSHEYSISEYQHMEKDAQYTVTEDSCFQMFDSILWIFSMIDALDSVYN